MANLLVEVAERVRPGFFAFFDLVQFFFQPGGVLDIENVAEIFHQQIGHHQADFRRRKFSAQLLHVLPLLDGAENGGVRGRASDAAFFQFFHQRSFVIARRWFGEVLLRFQLFQSKLLPGFKRRQLVLEFFVFFVLAFFGFFVHLEETIELEHGPGHTEPEVVGTRFCIDVDRGLIEDGGSDLRSYESSARSACRL